MGQSVPSASLQMTQNWEKRLRCQRFCQPKGSGQAGEMGWQEPHKVQQGEMQSPSPGYGQLQVPRTC